MEERELKQHELIIKVNETVNHIMTDMVDVKGTLVIIANNYISEEKVALRYVTKERFDLVTTAHKEEIGALKETNQKLMWKAVGYAMSSILMLSTIIAGIAAFVSKI